MKVKKLDIILLIIALIAISPFLYNNLDTSITGAAVSEISTSLPYKASYMSCAENPSDNSIYCFGGYNNGSSDKIAKFNTKDKTTKSVGNLPSPRFRSDCLWHEKTGDFYCVSGETEYPSMPNVRDEIVKLDSSTGDSTIVKELSYDFNIGDASCVSHSSGKIFCLGEGTSNSKGDDVLSYDPSTNSVQSSYATLSNKVITYSCAENPGDNNIYCYSFIKDKGNKILSFDPSTKSSQFSDISFEGSSDFQDITCSKDSNNIYCVKDFSEKNKTDVVSRLDPSNNRFETVKDFKKMNGYSCAGGQSSDIYCFGGAEYEGIIRNYIGKIFKIVNASSSFDAPVTTTNLKDKWYNQTVDVDLNCTDDKSCSLTKVCKSTTKDCVPDKTTNNITISNEGINYISYYSEDTGSNIENLKTSKIKIDKTPPSTKTLFNTSNENNSVNIKLESSNDSLSGVKKIEIKYKKNNDGEKYCKENMINQTMFSFPEDCQNNIDVKPLDDIEIKVRGVDRAGNAENFKTKQFKPKIKNYSLPDKGKTSKLSITDSAGEEINDDGISSENITVTNKSSNRKLASFKLNKTENIGLQNLTLNYSEDSVSVDTSKVKGLTKEHTLYLPNDNDGSGVVVCPEATKISEISLDCNNKKEFNGGFPETKDGITVRIENNEYIVKGLKGTGVELLSDSENNTTNTTDDETNDSVNETEDEGESIRQGCQADWECTSWSQCSNGIQTRECTDQTKCKEAGYPEAAIFPKKPEVERKCEKTISCSDGVKNGNETGVDCGGNQCSKCEVEKTCNVDNDCKTGNCINGVCKEKTTECVNNNQCSNGKECVENKCKTVSNEPKIASDSNNNDEGNQTLETQTEERKPVNTNSNTMLYIYSIITFIGIIASIIILYYLIQKNYLSNDEQEYKHSELIAFIHERKSNGQSKHRIKAQLINKGWPEDLVDKYMQEAFNNE